MKKRDPANAADDITTTTQGDWSLSRDGFNHWIIRADDWTTTGTGQGTTMAEVRSTRGDAKAMYCAREMLALVHDLAEQGGTVEIVERARALLPRAVPDFTPPRWHPIEQPRLLAKIVRWLRPTSKSRNQPTITPPAESPISS